MNNILGAKGGDGYGIIDVADTLGHKNSYIDYLHKLALEQVGVCNATDVVLDFGCGIGRLSHWLGDKCSRVYGIDIGKEVLSIAAQHNARANVIYQVYDGETIPFAESSFDVILLVGVFHRKSIFPEDKLARILGEFYRVLKPNGRIIMIGSMYGRRQSPSYRREEILTHFAKQNLTCTSHYPIRKGRTPLLYMIRYGLIPPRFIPRLAQHELSKRRHEHEAFYDYKDYLFCFEKKTGVGT